MIVEYICQRAVVCRLSGIRYTEREGMRDCPACGYTMRRVEVTPGPVHLGHKAAMERTRRDLQDNCLHPPMRRTIEDQPRWGHRIHYCKDCGGVALVEPLAATPTAGEG